MVTTDPQAIWDAYYEGKKAQRLEEAGKLWAQMHEGGVAPETVVALDFLHFGTNQANVDALARQLSENYSMEVSAADGVWQAKGTTRPGGVTLSQQQHAAWAGFMSDVARSYACVFSTWSVEAPSLGLQFRSEDVESAS